ncbi:MAG: hypothetical protein RLZZ385_2816 [Pseudomonadota bacterium]|jgi:outer membrane lipoprotein LolB
MLTRGLPTLTLSTLLLLAGCSGLQAPTEGGSWRQRQAQLSALDHWQLQGRVNARYYDESHTPRIRWQQRDEDYTIRLWGTLNAGATLIEGRPGHVTLEQGSELRQASRPEDLILEHLGYELPVSQLNYWIKGLPMPGEDHQLRLGDFNEVVHLEQSGWSMDYEDYRLFDSVSLPRRIRMVRDEEAISLQFIGLDWNVEAPDRP